MLGGENTFVPFALGFKSQAENLSMEGQIEHISVLHTIFVATM